MRNVCGTILRSVCQCRDTLIMNMFVWGVKYYARTTVDIDCV